MAAPRRALPPTLSQVQLSRSVCVPIAKLAPITHLDVLHVLFFQHHWVMLVAAHWQMSVQTYDPLPVLYALLRVAVYYALRAMSGRHPGLPGKETKHTQQWRSTSVS